MIRHKLPFDAPELRARAGDSLYLDPATGLYCVTFIVPEEVAENIMATLVLAQRNPAILDQMVIERLLADLSNAGGES